MTILAISPTQFSRNLSDLLNKVRYQHVTLEIMRGKEAIAYVTPASAGAGYPIDQLDRLLEGLPVLSDDDAQRFLDDLHGGVVTQPVESDAWGS